MKKRSIIAPALVEKYKNDICFIIETNVTYMEAVEPRVKFIDPMGYEMIEELIEVYTKIILENDRDEECPRWGTYEEKVKEFHSEFHRKDTKKKVEKKIDVMLKELGIKRLE